MTECTQSSLEFPGFSRRKIEASFDGGDITGNGGAQLLRLADERIGLTRAAARAIGDSRRGKSCAHDLESLIRQRVYGIALGHEDLNDHDGLRSDLALQTALHRTGRWRARRRCAGWSSGRRGRRRGRCTRRWPRTSSPPFDRAPRRLVLDVNATDDRVHGDQEGRFFHGYYDHYCFLPLYVFCGEQLLVSYLRPSKIDGAKHSWAVLALLIKRLRRAWPGVEITVRGDSGFCRWRMLRWFDRNGVDYVIGVARNARLLAISSSRRHRASGEKQRLFGEVRYGARGRARLGRRPPRRRQGGARRPRRQPALRGDQLKDDPQRIYERVYCARGDMENRIKEQQLDLHPAATSGGPTSSGCSCRASPTRCWRRSAGRRCAAPCG